MASEHDWNGKRCVIDSFRNIKDNLSYCSGMPGHTRRRLGFGQLLRVPKLLMHSGGPSEILKR